MKLEVFYGKPKVFDPSDTGKIHGKLDQTIQVKLQ